MPSVPHVLFAGGGKAGHFFPGIAVAQHLQRKFPNVELTFAGAGQARERHAVRAAGFRYTTIPAQPLPETPLQMLRFVTDNTAGYVAARWMLREQQVSAVVGLGGSTCASVTRAAVARGVPVVMLEQNAVPSRTTKWLSRWAAVICAAFEEIRPHLHVKAEMTVTGCPARPEFEQLYRAAHRGEGSSATRRPRRLVILGGAGGARSLNEQMPGVLKQLQTELAGWQVVHQTGEGQLAQTESRYRQAGADALVVSYIDEVASVMFASDVVVCRPSGTTLAELALAGAPAILVPYPVAADNHQLANAKMVAAAGAARVIDESSVTGSLGDALATELRTLLASEATRTSMSQHMLSLARPDAAAEIAEAVCQQLCAASGHVAA